MKFGKYESYRASGLGWISDLPASWGAEKFSRAVHIAEGQVAPDEEPFASMLLIAPNHVESGTGRLLEEESAADQGAESGKYMCRAGDVIYSKIRPALAKVVIAPEDCLCSADMYPLRVSERLASRYLLWLLLSHPFTAWSVLESDRVAMPKINRDTLSELRLPIPPLPDQETIAQFLDRQTSRVDTLVAKKRTLIAKLKEKRSALISRTVTRGLPPDAARAAGFDPTPEMRASGIDWLGDIPAHWFVKPLKRMSRIGNGSTPNRDTPAYWSDEGFPGSTAHSSIWNELRRLWNS